MSMVKSPKCGQSFDKEKVECLHFGTRYYHLSCCSEDFIYTEKIFDYTKSLWGAVSKPKITKQIESFKKEYNYTIKQIYEDLVYFFDIKKGNTTSYQNTIGIVPFIHNEAQRYYLMIKIKESQKENITQILEVNTSEVKTVYFSKQPQKKRLQFEIETEEKG